MSCAAGRNCLKRRVIAKTFLGLRDVTPPRQRFVALFTDKGFEVSGESYARRRISLQKSESGRYENDSPFYFRVAAAEEDWGRVAATAVMASEKPGTGECCCIGGSLEKARRLEAGDKITWDKSAFSLRFGGERSGASSYLCEKWNDFIFGDQDFLPPQEFHAGLLSASPVRDRYTELLASDYNRLRVRWQPGRDGMTAFNSDELKWVVKGASWDVSAIAIWNSADPFDLESRLLWWSKLPFGGRRVEPDDAIVVEKGKFSIP